VASSLRDAVVGSLTALAAGDCLGLPVEGWHPGDIQARFGGVRAFAWDEPVWSDDTQQALALIEVFARHGQVRPDDVGEVLVARLEAHPGRRFGLHRGTGRGFRRAVSAYARDHDWRTSADPERVGNGAAMRIAPLAARLRDSPDEEFVHAVVNASIVTHRDARSITAAAAVARASQVTSASTSPLDTVRFLRTVADVAEADAARIGEIVGEILAGRDHLGDVAGLLARLAARAEAGAGRDALLRVVGSNVVDVLGPGRLATDGWALASPIAAIVVAACARDVEDGLVTAVNLGGDADTTGAMVGGIVGAAAGAEGLPGPLRRFPGYEALVAWAAASVEGTAPDTLPDLLELERRLCDMRDGA
jgi:ADP-ribosylglycohydrolase